MWIGYLHCERCGYRTEEFMCVYRHWRGGYHVPVQDQETLAIRLVRVPDDDVFYGARDDRPGGTGREEAIARYVDSVEAGSTSSTEREIPVLEMIRTEALHVPCPACREPLAWHNTGTT